MTPRCSVYIAVSLDGFIARRDGTIDWLSIVEQTGEDYGYKAFVDSVDALVFGRNTYDVVLGFDPWPYTGKRCVVMTHATPKHGEELLDPAKSGQHKLSFFAGAPAELLNHLSRDGVKRIYVDGGKVIQQFLAAGLIDDITVSIVPVLLGEGVPLFGTTGRDVRLDLVRSRSFPSGLVQNEYRVRRP